MFRLITVCVYAVAARAPEGNEKCMGDEVCQAAIDVDVDVAPDGGSGSLNLLQVQSPGKAAATISAQDHRAEEKPFKSGISAITTEENRTAGRVVRHKGEVIGRTYGHLEAPCDKFTGGTCFAETCDASRSAVCTAGMCICPDYTCHNGYGACMISPSEIAGAIADGVTDVGDKLTDAANSVPGISSAISGISNTFGTVGNAVSEVIGLKSGCKQWVGSCVFSGCPSSTSLTAECSTGLCTCKENFCYQQINGQPMCTVDIARLGQYVASMVGQTR